MWDLLKRVWKAEPKDKIYNSMLDEYNRYCDAGYRMKFNAPADKVFALLIKASLKEFGSPLELNQIQTGVKFVQSYPNKPSQLFTITKYETNVIYQLFNKSNKTEYWTTFEVLNTNRERCEIQFSQLVRLERTLDKVFNGREKFQFRSQVGKKGRFLQEQFTRELSITRGGK